MELWNALLVLLCLSCGASLGFTGLAMLRAGVQPTTPPSFMSIGGLVLAGGIALLVFALRFW
ncbi:hypothetical protein EV699_11536 [Plasticicumulans lactativorans]|uniref:Uncharacterized protein n=1 Tax=Plasticicumulans lactativorans TaxID=1133106 RepID=A0A4V2SCP8_9GAMM|nr:hypothetical protein [Plasticicumulans lactativorans]TCO80260.1 hypothetical protein EV699_11536 [Plasticicumulans lactativorans]